MKKNLRISISLLLGIFLFGSAAYAMKNSPNIKPVQLSAPSDNQNHSPCSGCAGCNGKCITNNIQQIKGGN